MTSEDNDLERQLIEKYGYLIGGTDLPKLLGLRSAEAMRQAKRRGTVGVRLFNVRGRRGLFANTIEVASWLTTSLLTTRLGEQRVQTEGVPMT